MFVDKAEILIQAGNGGDGAVSFHREKYIASGGPDGGDGGRGGNIVFQTDSNLSTLADFRYKRKYHAENGVNGRGNRCSGKQGEDLVIRVPSGTLIRDKETGLILADMSTEKPFIAARGGRGGWGNRHFATPTHQTPRFAKTGFPGEKRTVVLELKLLADVGLIGFPNVGKSSLISVVSEAKPAIGNYHFTTLTPVLGVVRMGPESSFVMADIPGLIEGAGDGAGLGHEFLRHVERCRLLIHVVDVSGSEGRNPIEDFETINQELVKFNPELANCPQIVAANKIDLAEEENLEEFRQFIKQKGLPLFEIIAPIAEGTKELVDFTAAELAKLPPLKIYESEEQLLAQPDPGTGRNQFSIQVQDGVYYIEGEWLAKILNQTDIEDYESLQYFQLVLRKSGIIDALIEAGINDGDTVDIYGLEFDYVP